jgi:hypothetical protein
MANKIISFIVSKDYHNEKLENIISNNDIAINQDIINYGVLIYELLENKQISDSHIESIKETVKENLSKEYKNNIDIIQGENIILKNDCKKFQEQITSLKNNIELISNEKNTEIASFIEKGKQLIKDEYQLILNMQTENNKKLEHDLKSSRDKIQELTNQLISNSQNCNNKDIKTIDSSINQLNDKFTSYFDKIFTNNTAKGDYGEDFVQNYLVDKFSGSVIIDTHKETAKGDILFTHNQLKTLIEIKNVQQVKPTEIDKFYRDVQVQKDSGINSALFISLNDTSFTQGKKIIHFEIKYNIPIFMISNAFNNPENIRLAIIIMEYLIKHQFIFNQENNDKDSQKLQILIMAINEIYEYTQSQKKILEDDQSIIKKLTDNLKKREKQIIDIDIIINNIFKQYPQLQVDSKDSVKSKESEKNDIPISDNIEPSDSERMAEYVNPIVIKIINHITQNNIIKFNKTNINIKLLKLLQISDNNIRYAGGVKNIQKQFNITYKSNNTEATLADI